MSHHIYTTPGFVIRNVPFAESSSYVYIFTRDLGLIGASARSVRAIQSKLRYGLQDFCYSTVSLVRGKYEWKITNAIPQENLYALFVDDKKFLVFARALSLIKKLVTGEEKNEPLFEVIYSGFVFLRTNHFSAETLRNFECIIMLRILYHLGYSTPEDVFKLFVVDTVWNTDLLLSINAHYHDAIRAINSSIKESQL